MINWKAGVIGFLSGWLIAILIAVFFSSLGFLYGVALGYGLAVGGFLVGNWYADRK